MSATTTRNAAELLDAYHAGEREFTDWAVRDGVLLRDRFEGCRFAGAVFRDVTGVLPTFDNCSFDEATFSQCILLGAGFVSSSMRGARFEHSTLDRTDFFRTTLAGANFTDCSVRGSCFLHADLSDCKIDDTRFGGALFGRTAFTGHTLYGSDFADSVVALPHRIATGELQHIQAMAHAAKMFAMSPDTHEAGTARWLADGMPRLLDFLERGGVTSGWLEPLRSAITLAPAHPRGSVFLAYATEDQAVAEQLAELLQQAGLDTWFAPRSLRGGRKLYDQLVREVDARDRVVFLASPASLASPWVQLELRRALAAPPMSDARRRVVPVLFTDETLWRAWQLVDADTGRDLAAELRAGRCFSLHGAAGGDDQTQATLRALIDELVPASAPPAAAAEPPPR